MNSLNCKETLQETSNWELVLALLILSGLSVSGADTSLTYNSFGFVQNYSSRKVAVTIFDGETNAPISGGHVDLTYTRGGEINSPPPSVSALTDKNGAVVINGTTFLTQVWTFSAPGYISYKYEIISSGSPLPPLEATMKIPLYHLPAAHLTIIVPKGYRGLVKIDMQPTTSPVSSEIGERDFTYHISPSGHVVIPASPLLTRLNLDTIFDTRVPKPDLSIEDEDGHTIPVSYTLSEPPAEIMVRVGAGEKGFRNTFTIGTEADQKYFFLAGTSPIPGSTGGRYLGTNFDAVFDDQSIYVPTPTPIEK